jgi:hypothetical protein
MNGYLSLLPVAMVSVGLMGRVVTRQQEKDQHKERWSGAVVTVCRMRWGEDRIRDRQTDTENTERQEGVANKGKRLRRQESRGKERQRET